MKSLLGLVVFLFISLFIYAGFFFEPHFIEEKIIEDEVTKNEKMSVVKEEEKLKKEEEKLKKKQIKKKIQVETIIEDGLYVNVGITPIWNGPPD